jgi:hypothetical protein
MATVTATDAPALRRQLDLCRERLDQGTLVAGDLELALRLFAPPAGEAPRARQDLLFIQAANTHLGSHALGMSMVLDGVFQEPPMDPEQWPYPSVLAALQDGWRIIAFPNQALLLNGPAARGLGCEFVLERWQRT